MVVCKVATAQEYISGTVYDSSKNYLIPGVKVISSSGKFTFTDSLGRYSLQISNEDSINFIFRNKPTQNFAIKNIFNRQQFDISLKVTYKGKYTTLKNVTVYSKTHQEDSIENRITYKDIFNYKKPRIKTDISPGGAVGMDLDELINMFRFKRNKRIKAFQLRLEAQEEEKYVNYRFNKTTVKRITNLKDELIDGFLIKYRPSYDFVINADEMKFNQYILNASYEYKRNLKQ